ncbi:MAG TPA: hypothetical protein VMU27_00780 [Candidatus Paceibacterota bacterium]|nr:hypothetical protein [Candidatus Paceibacterota bacterium]
MTGPWSDDAIKEEMQKALDEGHQEDTVPDDPFKLDALGHIPEEEDATGGDDSTGDE